MQQKKITKDEKCLLALYDLASQSEDPEEYAVDPTRLSEKTGLSPKALKAIVAELVRANFARNVDHTLIGITATGMKVARSLRP